MIVEHFYPWIIIRYNPDSFKVNGKYKRICKDKKLEILKSTGHIFILK
jgi:hypothetical protein